MTIENIRLGAQIRVVNPNHQQYHQEGRYMGPTELPGLENSHRICFDGKIQLINRGDFELITTRN